MEARDPGLDPEELALERLLYDWRDRRERLAAWRSPRCGDDLLYPSQRADVSLSLGFSVTGASEFVSLPNRREAAPTSVPGRRNISGRDSAPRLARPDVETLLLLQRSAGNAAVTRLLSDVSGRRSVLARQPPAPAPTDAPRTSGPSGRTQQQLRASVLGPLKGVRNRLKKGASRSSLAPAATHLAAAASSWRAIIGGAREGGSYPYYTLDSAVAKLNALVDPKLSKRVQKPFEKAIERVTAFGALMKAYKPPTGQPQGGQPASDTKALEREAAASAKVAENTITSLRTLIKSLESEKDLKAVLSDARAQQNAFFGLVLPGESGGISGEASEAWDAFREGLAALEVLSEDLNPGIESVDWEVGILIDALEKDLETPAQPSAQPSGGRAPAPAPTPRKKTIWERAIEGEPSPAPAP